jgi:hypothetical protein
MQVALVFIAGFGAGVAVTGFVWRCYEGYRVTRYRGWWES